VIAQPLRALRYHSPVASAQVKSAVLLAGLYADGPSTLIEDAPTRDHTERMLTGMGATLSTQRNGAQRTITLTPPARLAPLDLTVPADLSSAAFFMVAATIVPGARITLRDVGLNETRTGLIDVLRNMGASIQISDTRDEGGEPAGTVTVAFDELNPVTIAGELTARSIDELPILAVAATQAAGVTVVRDAEELRVKESNRLEGYVAELRKLGADIRPTADGFTIHGPTRLRGTPVSGMGDHRVAMSLAVAALVADGDTTILGADCVSKTYPTFFDDLARLSA
jgi:3-phosphoshikimate 1-carboxyvinyltransferase